MATLLSIYVDDRDMAALRHAAIEVGKTVEQCAEAAVSEAAGHWRRTHMERGIEEDE